MRELPIVLRVYLCATYLACFVLIGRQIELLATGIPVWHAPLAVLPAAALFVVLACVAERTPLRIDNPTARGLVSTVHIAVILTFPAPFPVLITLVASLLSQATEGRSPLYRRLCNVCVPTLAVGVCASVGTPSTLLSAGHVLKTVPQLTLLLSLYYLLGWGLSLPTLVLPHRQRPWRLWWQTQRHNLAIELAVSGVGILTAVAWRFDPVLLLLFVAPLVAARVGFRTKASDDRAAALHRRSEQLETVLAAGQRLRIQQTQADLLLPVAEAARTLTDAAAAIAYLRDADNPALLTRVVVVLEGAPMPVTLPGDGSYLPAPPPGQAWPEEAEGGEGGWTLRVSLEPDDAGVAGLLVLGGIPSSLDHDGRDALAILATQAAIALQNVQLHERALAQASQDSLTGLLNHRAFQMRLAEEVERAFRTTQPLALLMVDLDDFRSINNTLGHQAGDQTLLAVAAALRASVRAGDLPARYGGDEFAVILPATDQGEAFRVAERVVAAVAALCPPALEARLGASVGVAALPHHARTREELVHAADRAAYAAKHGGKGRVGWPEEAEAVAGADNSADLAALMDQLEHANMATVAALAAAVDAKDPYTRGHSQRVAGYAVAIAAALGFQNADVERIRLAGQLHDVGKIGVPDAVLMKSGGLDDAEFALLRQHAVIGERMLSAVPSLQDILPAVRHHHEHYDGRGYPDGLAGDELPADAAILAVADAFDAMTSSRTYRAALSAADARSRVRAGSGTQFAPRVVAAFEKAITDGSFVPLSSGGTARLDPERIAHAS